VEDMVVVVICFKSGALGSILLSNSQKPGIYGKVHIHGSSGASVGVQTDGGAMFIAGMTSVLEPPINDLWTVPGEEVSLSRWQNEDRVLFDRVDATQHYHLLQIQEFLQAILEDREPMITGEEGRKTVELFTAIYRSQRDQQPVRFPLDAESSSEAFDGRLSVTG
jgi:UDP-N-acetyl-2-amino-2-deoxyglucuronate dehydrogenase